MRVLTPESSWLLRYVRSYPGTPDQVRHVRAFLREALAGCPRADDAVTLASEFAANAILHSRSGAPGRLFTVRAEISECAYIWVGVQDDGGTWHPRACQVQSGHGLDLVQAIAGPSNWGISDRPPGRLAWARLAWPGTDRLDRELTTPETTMNGYHESNDDMTGELDKLAAALTACGLQAQLVTPKDRLPYLNVCDTKTPGLTERVYSQADWYFWPTAERIAACDDITTAADTITRILRIAGE
jgi:serine/threonine-protein kinase RsbW